MGKKTTIIIIIIIIVIIIIIIIIIIIVIIIKRNRIGIMHFQSLNVVNLLEFSRSSISVGKVNFFGL